MFAGAIIQIFVIMVVPLSLVLGVSEPCSAASPYPEKPVTMLVGLAAGGANDLTARALAEAVKTYLPQPISIVNKTGGAASIATADVVHSRPDGYTLLMAYSPAVVLLPHLNPNLPYKGPGDLEMVCGVNISPLVLASRSNAPWKTMQEMLDHAKKNPGKIRLGQSGIGSVGHIFAEDLKQAARIDITVVPFAGAAPATTALLGGHIDLINTSPAPLIGHLKNGTIRNLAAYEKKRLARFPDVPTMRELGLEVIDRSPVYFVAGPKGLSKEVVQTLYQAFSRALKTESFQKFCNDTVHIVDEKSPEEVRKQQESDYDFYKQFFKRIKIE